MKIKEHIEADLKQALLSGDKTLVSTLRTLKSAILYEEVSFGKRDEGLSENEAIQVLAREAKKRQESIDLYRKGGNEAQATAEQKEKAIIGAYLPNQVSAAEVDAVLDTIFAAHENPSMKDMGQIMSAAKAELGASVDGAMLAKKVKERLDS